MEVERMDKSHLVPTAGDASQHRSLSHASSPSQEFHSARQPSLADMHVAHDKRRKPRKLVLCFDGTGNKFRGDDSDSNILKIFRMLDRTADDQYHYYQPGIGTYVVSNNLSHTSIKGRIKSWYQKAKDSAVGSSFDHHVVGGYRFLMRFYCPGDEIYIFGFSRGAYIARFLAQMLDYVGLLSHGNEEMVAFAWKAFSQWQCRSSDTSDEGVEKRREMYTFMKGFRETFSRPVRRIRFLGLFDTVNSVPRFETAWMERSKFPYTARSSAKVIRHAVSIDERRAKFRQDLMYQKSPKAEKKVEGYHLWHEMQERYRASVAGPGHAGGVTKPVAAEVEDRGRKPSHSGSSHNGTEPAPYRAHSRSKSRQVPHAKGAKADDESDNISRLAPSDDDSDDSDDETEQDMDEVWFAGGHGDVGGGWEITPGTKSASHVPLAWMVREAIRAGLTFDAEKLVAMGCTDVLDNIGIPDDADGRQLGKSAIEEKDFAPAPPRSMPTFHFDPSSPPGSPDPDLGGGVFTNGATANGVSSNGVTNGVTTNGTSNGATTNGATNDRAAPEVDDDDDTPRSHFHAMMHRAHTAPVHDSLAYSSGLGFGAVTSWKLMEYMPFRRMDMAGDGTWKPIRWPLPCGETRDVPHNVRVHGSVIRRMRRDESYRPGNLIVGGGGRGCRVAPEEHGMGEWEVVAERGDPIGEIWMRKADISKEGA